MWQQILSCILFIQWYFIAVRWFFRIEGSRNNVFYLMTVVRLLSKWGYNTPISTSSLWKHAWTRCFCSSKVKCIIGKKWITSGNSRKYDFILTVNSLWTVKQTLHFPEFLKVISWPDEKLPFKNFWPCGKFLTLFFFF